MNDLSPREQAIVALALGRGALDVARELDVPEAAVRRVGGLLGWPGDTRQLKRAASAIHAGQRLWAGELAERPDDVTAVGSEGQAPPAPEATAHLLDDCRDDIDCGGCSCHLGNSAPCVHCTDHEWPAIDPAPITDQGDPMPKPTPDEAAEALAVLGDVEQLTSPPGLEPADPSRATLVMPLVHLVDDVDGTRTLVAQAVVEVRILPDGLIGYLGGDGNAGVIDYDVTRQLTPDGVAAVRTLAALLPPVRDAEAPPWA